MARLRPFAAASALLLAAGCSGGARKPALPFWEMEPRHHPPTSSIELRLLPRHPRLVFRSPEDARGGRTFDAVRRLYAADPTMKAILDKALAVEAKNQCPAMLAVSWMITGEDRYAEAAVARMVSEELGKSGEPYYSNIWRHALAYDWLFHHPAFTQEKKDVVVARIRERLATELADLDGDGLALWHGRTQEANGVMIAALAIGDLPGMEPTLRRAAAHYVETLKALEFSEGWPEGASYWIYNRAGPFAVGADCAMTALGTDRIAGISIPEVIGRLGFWQLYQFGPNKVFEPYGDSGGSCRLGETGWWELSTDYYARLSKNPALMAGADYIRNRSPIPYGKRPYYWYAALSFDPAVRPRENYDPAAPELWMREHLPQAMLFGRKSMGVAFLRGKWGDPDETYATFKAGDMMAHHDHYNAGHFGIQKGGELAPQTGLYGPGGYTGKHRLGYLVQTVSVNSLLVLAPGEESAYLLDKRRKDPSFWTALSGGQRVIRPTGFTCVSLEHFQDMLDRGPHLRRSVITAFESAPRDFDYLAADITAAYNSTRWAEPGAVAKVSLVTRQFLHLRGTDAFVIYDRIETTKPEYLPKFLVHHLAKPESAEEKQLAGPAPDDGILETLSRTLTTGQARGRLTHTVVLPEKARALKIGGAHYYCYVEADGDQSNGFTGENLGIEGGPLPPRKERQLGLWRTEVEPTERTKSTRFLNVLAARTVDEQAPPPEVRRVDAGADADAVLVGGTVCVFARGPGALKSFRLTMPGARCLVLDAAPGASYAVGEAHEAKTKGARVIEFGGEIKAGAEGVLVIDRLPAGECTVRRVRG
ncbi:MAG TPA: hypothetical protein PK280_04865 [Planctomycetota bacterium]|nr:hypothetical protein [Planctomycetota bacterium]